jgi:hypothetical protein
MASTRKSGEAREPREYVVVDNPFYDGVQLHPVGARVIWAGPPSNSLVPWEKRNDRVSTTEAPIFGDPLGGRGDGAPVKAADPGAPVVLVQ